MRRGVENSKPFPLDLIIEICLLLPSKSIARFLCVSKLWYSTLRCPNFTKSFFTISSSSPKLLFACLKDGKTFFFTSPQPQDSSPLAAKLQISFPINLPTHIARPVRGLLCGLDRKKLPVICNPSTGQFLTLPELINNSYIVRSYLGYDPVNKQFKILCTEFYGRVLAEAYQVLTLGTGKKLLWRMIECDIPHYPANALDSRDSFSVYDEICINGVCYYFARLIIDTNYPVIVCFDIRSEKFSFIYQAEGMILDEYNTYPLLSTLVNYKGKLAKLKLNNIGNCIQLWVLMDAEKHGWLNCTYNFHPPRNNNVKETVLRCLGMTATGEIVLSPESISDSFYLLYYNLERNTFNKVEVEGMEGFKHCKSYIFLDHVEDVKDLKFYGEC